MKKSLIILSVLILSCKKESLKPVTDVVGGERSGIEKNYPALRFEFKTGPVINPNSHVGVGNLTGTDLTPFTSLCCDGQQSIEFDYMYGSIPNGQHYIDAFADTLIDYGVRMATIDVYGYDSLYNGCPYGINLGYSGQSYIKEGKIKWATYVISVPMCHYVNAKLRIFDGAPDTLYVQVFKGQPVTMTYNKYWK